MDVDISGSEKRITNEKILNHVIPTVKDSRSSPSKDRLPPKVRNLIVRMRSLGVHQFHIHDDKAANWAADSIGSNAFCLGNHVYLGSPEKRDRYLSIEKILLHELTHILQIHRYHTTGIHTTEAQVEREVDKLGRTDIADLDVRCGALPHTIYGLWWFIPMAIGTYLMTKSNVANAPEPGGKTYNMSMGEVAGELISFFFVPSAAFNIGGRLGWGFYKTSAVAGGLTATSFRASKDINRGQFSGVQVYVFDALTGSAIGILVPGGIKLFGYAGNRSLDWLATRGMTSSDIAIGKMIQQRLAVNPMSFSEVNALLMNRGTVGKASEWWLNRRGQLILYRGQGQQSSVILSPLARQRSVQASEELVARMRALGISDSEIAAYTAQWHTQAVPRHFTLPQLVNEPLGAVGIPTTKLPGIASNFGSNGVVYVLRIPKNSVIQVPKWGLAAENEWVILNQIPKKYIIDVLPASRFPSIHIDSTGKLALP